MNQVDRYIVISFDADGLPYGPSQTFVDVMPLGTHDEAIAMMQKARPYATFGGDCLTADEFLRMAQEIKTDLEKEVVESYQSLLGEVI